MLAAFGCGRQETFECDADGDCAGVEAVGRCEPNGWCSFPDDTCPSKRRYGTHAGDGLASTCVPVDDGTGEGSGSATGGPSSDGSGNDPSTEPPTTVASSSSEDGGPGCGNGVREADEECDRNDFGGRTCADFGHASGTLDCDGCTIDASGCHDCGDGILQDGELCDGSAVSQTCADLGWAGGTLACGEGCRAFDESGCNNCGNAFVDEGEHCDGSIGAATCESLGYAPGELACTACRYDVAGCGPLVCGDDATTTGGPCPDACASCEGELCLLDCSGTSACNDKEIVCPAGWPCRVLCDGTSSCNDAIVVCPDFYACGVECEGTSACSDLQLQCSLTGTCSMACSDQAAVCSGAIVDCGSDACSAKCDGDEPTVDCGPSCSCSTCG